MLFKSIVNGQTSRSQKLTLSVRDRWAKHVLCVKGGYFENGGSPILIGILHVLLNILSISLLSKVPDVWLFRNAKRLLMSFYDLNKINKMQVAG